MAGASMFLIYQDGTGNVTLSTRAGKGEIMPLHVQQNNVHLLAGSGVKGGKMTANVVCKGCDGLDLSGVNNWIMAKKAGKSLSSTDENQAIDQHDSHASFNVDFTKASITTDANPFVASSSSGHSSAVPPPSHTGGVTQVSSNPNDNLIFAHGIIMAVVFLAIYPLGSILMPLFGKWYLHVSWQMIGFLLMWAGFGIGYVVSHRLDIVSL